MKNFCFILLLSVFGWPLVAQTVTIDDAIDEKVFFLKEIEFFVDTTNQLSFLDISSAKYAEKFTIKSSYQNKDYLSDASYWIRFSIKPDRDSKKKWLIEFYDQTIDELEVFQPTSDGIYEHHLMGDHFEFSKRNFLHKNFEIPLDFKDESEQVFYFRIQSHEFADIRFALRSVNWFVFYALNEYFLYGTFYGMILVIVLYNFMMFLAIREIKYIYYIFYIISVAFYAMSIDGIGFQYFWPNHPEWNDYVSGIFLYSLILWALVFTRRFLSTRAKVPMLDKALLAMIVLRTLVFLFELFFYPEFFAFRSIEILPLSLIFFTGVKVWMRRYRPARYFVIAYGLLLFGFLFRTMVFFDWIQLTTVSHYTLHFSFVIEMLFLTLALGDRITILKDNRDRALKRIIKQHELNMELKDKVNRELEAKVKERTITLDKKNAELEESNLKLVKQTHEINQINSVLDLDNWKLKNNLKEVINERLHDKTMEYEQFITLYPDALACYRFLESLKWDAGFRCKKCDNDKYFKGAQKFARRCTRCGYNESITAFTLFQGLKFPIEKAFYISYLAVKGKNGRTLETIAGNLDVGLNTVWGFMKKVEGTVASLSNNGKRISADQWESVILVSPVKKKKRINANRTPS